MQKRNILKDNPAIIINAAVALIAAILTFIATRSPQEVQKIIQATQNAEATIQPINTHVAQTIQPLMTEIATRSTVQVFESNIEFLETRVDMAELTRDTAIMTLEDQLSIIPSVVVEQFEVTRIIEVTPFPINYCELYEIDIGSVTKDNIGRDVITISFSSAPPRDQLQIF